PFDVTTDSSGNIYVADSGNDRIVKFDPSGNYLMQFGISGNDDGQFMDPRGVAVDKSGNLYVADTTNNRIEKLDSSGKFISQIHDWSTAKDLQTMPEFPFAVPVMLIGIVASIVFYGIKIRK
ncbi:MAG: SBBP repeat-containing protein, partial [Thaumarchaeota archaeon]|nr:SBBP repeat-containing protein [Nitrososphaerota archaeon]